MSDTLFSHKKQIYVFVMKMIGAGHHAEWNTQKVSHWKEGGHDQCTVHACMKMSQWNPLICKINTCSQKQKKILYS
jgi:hypothetical protein